MKPCPKCGKNPIKGTEKNSPSLTHDCEKGFNVTVWGAPMENLIESWDKRVDKEGKKNE